MKTFDEWWLELEELAFKENFGLMDKELYREYYDDGDSPSETLALELSYLPEDDDVYDSRFNA